MAKDYINITIRQVSDDEFDIYLYGNIEDSLKALAGAVSQTIAAAPKEYQQLARNRFLGYLNHCTIEDHIKDL